MGDSKIGQREFCDKLLLANLYHDLENFVV